MSNSVQLHDDGSFVNRERAEARNRLRERWKKGAKAERVAKFRICQFDNSSARQGTLDEWLAARGAKLK